MAAVQQTPAQGTRFFRVSGPAATRITAFLPNGTLVWSNAQAGTNYMVQTATFLSAGANWVNYVQIPVTQSVHSNLIVDLNPPAGMTLIPAGWFKMGDTLDHESDAIPTNICVSAFYMDVNLVSYSQWEAVFICATNHGYGFDDDGSWKAMNEPVQTNRRVPKSVSSF